MSHPKRADHFKEWAKMMLEQATVPDRLQYKGQSVATAGRLVHKKQGKRRKRRFRHIRRHRKKQD